MRSLPLITAAALVLSASAASAFHRDGHKTAFPGAPSGKFVLHPILAGNTCTAPIAEPEGVDAVGHGGPKKWGFIGGGHFELVVLAEDPDVVQFCFVDGLPRDADVQIRVSFEAEEVVE